MRWFTKSWWQYLLEPKSNSSDSNRFTIILCRIEGHPCGVWYYNPTGLEPDMTCKNCGDDLS